MAEVHDKGYGHQGSAFLVEGGKEPVKHAKLMQHTSVHGEGPANEPQHKISHGEHLDSYEQDGGEHNGIGQEDPGHAICEYEEAIEEGEVEHSDFAYLGRSEFGDLNQSDYDQGYKPLGKHNLEGNHATEGFIGGDMTTYDD